MLGEILPDLLLLAVVLAFVLRRGARSTAADLVRVLSSASRRSRRIAASTGSRRHLSHASAIAPFAEGATKVASAPRTMHALERGASPSLSTRIARAPWRYRLHLGRRAMAGRRLPGLVPEEATNVLGEPDAPTTPDEATVPTLARATAPNTPFPRRILLRLLHRLRGRRRAAQGRGRGGRLAFASRTPRAGSVLVLRSALLRAAQDDGHCGRRGARVMYPAASLSRLVLLLLRQTREGHPWPSLARLERMPRRHRRSVVRVLRALEERWVLEARPRAVAAGKAGAP